MNLTKQLKKAPFPPGLYAINGCQGAGKTSLATGILRTDYRRWRKWRFEQARSLAMRYFEGTGIRLEVDKTLYFSSPSITLDRRHGIKTWYIDLERLGLPNDEYEVQYLPRGSVVFLHEVDVLAYCRDWQSLDSYLRLLAKYCRHNLITIIFDLQVGGDLDKALRGLVIDRYFILNSGVKRFLLFWKRQRWNFICIHNQLANTLKELASFGIDLKVKLAERGKFRVWGNVFDCYNSFSGVPYFLYGIENHGYEYIRQEEGDLSIEGIQRYVQQHPLAKTEKVEEEKKPPAELSDKEKLELARKILAERKVG